MRKITEIISTVLWVLKPLGFSILAIILCDIFQGEWAKAIPWVVILSICVLVARKTGNLKNEGYL